jgi:hypothetical protein
MTGSRIPQVILNGTLLSERETRTLRVALGSLQLDLQTDSRDAKSPHVRPVASDTEAVTEHLRNLEKLVELAGDLDP